MTIGTMTIFALSLAAAAFAAGLPIQGVMIYCRFRGRRLVICPETSAPAAVEVDAARLAFSMADGHSNLPLATCSRWPERVDCGQECLHQIEAAPEDCLVRTIVARWYEHKRCALCRRDFGAIESVGHQTALLAPGGGTVVWGAVRPERLPALFTTHQPICWNCHVAESFRRQHGDLVTDRPAHHGSH
jgi:hypothetical protein